MQLNIYWNEEVSKRFPQLSISVGVIKDISVEKENAKVQKLKKILFKEMRAKYRIEKLKDNPTVRAYRDFYWMLGIDPTKIRPSGEALLRRVLHGGEIPTISTAVDSYNLASLETIIPISGFDFDKLNLPFNVRYAENGECFMGIGMEKPLALTDKMLVLADSKQVLCIYPYRDANQTKITEQTKNVLIVGYGAPGINERQLKEAVEKALFYIKETCHGELGEIKVFNASSKIR